MKTNLAIFTFFIGVIFFDTPSFAQSLEHYKKMVESTTIPSEKLVALDSIISKEGKTNIDVFVKNCEAYIQFAKENDSIEAAARKMIGLSYTLTSITNQPEKALRMIDELLARKYKIKDSFLVGSLYLKRGGANYRLNLEEATEDYLKAINNFTEKDSLYKADAYLFSGHAFSNLGKFVPAGDNYRKAYQYYEALKDYEYMIFAQQGITTMYSMNGFYDKAKEEREKNIQKLKALGLEKNIPVMYYNQALDYKKMGKKALHIEYLLKAYEFIKKDTENTITLTDKIYVYSKLIDFYLDEGNLLEAKKYFDLVQKNHDPTIKDLLYGSHYNEIMAKYHLALGNTKKALHYSEIKRNAATTMKYEEDIVTAEILLSKVYAALGDYKKALAYKESSQRLKDSLYNTSTANSLAYYQTLYETEKKENELIAKNASIQLLEKDNQAARRRLIFISLSLVLLFGLVFMYRNRIQLKNKKYLQEKYSQELLVSQEEERKRISKDLHDGLGQQLLLIKNKVVKNNDPETKIMVEAAIEDVRGISRDLHPFQLQELGVTKAIEMTLNQIDENTTLFISSEIDNIDNIFDKREEVNIFRIVQESLSNILKHANAEASKVTIKRNIGSVFLEIKDNGKGFDYSEKYQNLKSLGLKTLLERTKFLHGQMKVTSKKNQGTTLEFTFPTP
ncbi:MAG: sensor histidine kinase [Flavobacteriaceae bacterium]